MGRGLGDTPCICSHPVSYVVDVSVYDTYESLPDMIFLTVNSPMPIAELGHADRMLILST